MTSLAEKYRPRHWGDVVGQDDAVRLMRAIIESPDFDRGAFWIGANGKFCSSGMGKSSLAWVAAHALADDFFITRLKGADVDGPMVKDIERTAHLMTWGDKRYRVWIIEEAHQMTPRAVDYFLHLLEPLPKHCVIIFTSTRKIDEDLFGADAGPFGRRADSIMLTNQRVSGPYTARLQWIADQEGYALSAEDALGMIREHTNNLGGAIESLKRRMRVERAGLAVAA